ncbi:MAG: STAS domain-containing protein [Mariprofundaceae bacterium]|nr:STAS domain-containing protein [Mariprofundaceae bacterium]
MNLDIHTETDAQSTVLSLTGMLTMQTAQLLMKALDSLFLSNVSSITVDMSALKKMDSAGVATLVEGLRWQHKTKHSFILRSISKEALSLLHMYQLDTVFEVQDGR